LPGDLRCVVGARAGEQQAEFVFAHPRDDAGFIGEGGEAGGDGAQEVVAFQIAERLVDLVKAP
jgi:hypothetical protein